MSTNFDWSKYKPAEPESKEKVNSFDWSKYQEAQPVSKARSVAGAYPKGLIKGTSDFLSSVNPSDIISRTISGKDPNELLKRISEQVLPTRNETSENILGRAGELTPLAALGAESIPMKLAQLAGGTALGQIAQEEGLGSLGQGISEAVGMGLPGIAKGGYEGVANLLKGAEEKLPSGLTKLGAVTAKFPKKALISPERQAKVLSSLDKEAAELVKNTAHKRLPILQEIEKGVDFEQKFQEGFSQLKKSAEKFNPEINTKPIYSLLEKEVEKFRGIPTLHSDAKKIVNEIRNFKSKDPESLTDLLKIFRSNNQKRKHIFETSRLSGKQQEYVDFLGNINKAIGESFEKTFPKDSVWLKEFKDLNRNYGEFKSAQGLQNDLKKILNQEVTPASLAKFEDPKYQKKLELKIGKEGSQEIVQIAKDLKLARESVKKIPAREQTAWQKYLPFSFFIPGMGKALGVAKLPHYIQKAYGYILTMPERRKLFDYSLKAIISKNKDSYLKSTKRLADEFQSNESSE